MIPGSRLIYILLGVGVVSLFLSGVRIASDVNETPLSNLLFYGNTIWFGLLIILTIFSIIDLTLYPKTRELKAKRKLVSNLSLGVTAQVSITIENLSSQNITALVTDLYPNQVSVNDLPAKVSILGNSEKTITYPIQPLSRGNIEFGSVCLLIYSRLALWQKKIYIGETQAVKIYPNFAPIVRSAFIGLEHQLMQMGVHNVQRRGEGLNFQQLREFRKGDSLRQIDWKATSKLRKIISKEYQDEKDQEIIFLLDCGRSMRSLDSKISHFDHALNAMLLTSYIALRQGDAVGFMSFAGNEDRKLSPSKGKTAINAMLNKIYDLNSSTSSSDYLRAAEVLVKHHRKRSLVILITNLKDEQTDEITRAVQLLKRYHVVMVASLRDSILDNSESQSIENFNDALLYAGSKLYIEQRKPLVLQMRANKIAFVDCQPAKLHIELASEYMRIKRAGLI